MGEVGLGVHDCAQFTSLHHAFDLQHSRLEASFMTDGELHARILAGAVQAGALVQEERGHVAGADTRV